MQHQDIRTTTFTKFAILCLLLLAGAGLARGEAGNAYPARLLSGADATADITMMRRALEETHPGLTRYASRADIDAAFASLEKRVVEPITDLALYREISLMLATIRCDHTKAEYAEAMTRWREKYATHLPFRFKLFDGRMYVYSSDARQPALAKGTEVLQINDEPVAAIVQRLQAAVSIDGYTDASRNTKLEADSDLMGSDFDQFYPVFYGFAQEYRLQVRAPRESATRNVTLLPLAFQDWVRLPWSAATYRSEFYKSINWRIAGKNAVLKVDTFVNYRNPVDTMLFYSAFFRAANEAKVDHLVIDLRENGGGSNDATIALAAHLLEKPFVWNKPILQKAIRFGDWTRHVQVWGDPKEIFEAPEKNFRKRDDGWYEHLTTTATLTQLPADVAADRFRGKVTILSSPVNASGSTMLIAKLKDEKRVTVVGDPTGGSAEGPTAGRLFFLKLPASGIVVRIPNFWNRMNIQSFTSGKGVAPDIEVKLTVEDWLAGRDRAMDVALGKTQR